MSYLPRRVRNLVVFSAATLLASACAESAEPSADPGVENSQPDTTASPSDLLSPESFDAFLQENPDASLINVHIPYQQHIADTDAFIAFDQILGSPELPEDRSARIALYCRSGNMSGQAATVLAEAGYTNVVDLAGGMNAWTDSGRDLVDEPPSAG